MNSDLRTILLAGGLLFCLLFGGMTLAVALEYGVDVFTVAAVAVLALLVLALVGAIRNPPPR